MVPCGTIRTVHTKPCRAKNTSIKLPSCIKLAFHFISLYVTLWTVLLAGEKTIKKSIYREINFVLGHLKQTFLLLVRSQNGENEK